MKLYNVLFPIWFLIVMPITWLIVIPANFIIDSIVLLIAFAAFHITKKKLYYKQCILKVWLVGFAGDMLGSLVLLLTLLFPTTGLLGQLSSAVAWNPFENIWGILYVILAIVISSISIYWLNRKFALKKLDLEEKTKKKIAFMLAIITAPYLFLYPASHMYQMDRSQYDENTYMEFAIESYINQYQGTLMGSTTMTNAFGDTFAYTTHGIKVHPNIVSKDYYIDSQNFVLTAHIGVNTSTIDSSWEQAIKESAILCFSISPNLQKIVVSLQDGTDVNHQGDVLSTITMDRNQLETSLGISFQHLYEDITALKQLVYSTSSEVK